jgi:hypothetical protein
MVSLENFSVISAKSFLGKSVNLHLKDGSVIVNVQLTRLHKIAGKNNNQIEYAPLKHRRGTRIAMRNVAWAEMLNASLMKSSA